MASPPSQQLPGLLLAQESSISWLSTSWGRNPFRSPLARDWTPTSLKFSSEEGLVWMRLGNHTALYWQLGLTLVLTAFSFPAPNTRGRLLPRDIRLPLVASESTLLYACLYRSPHLTLEGTFQDPQCRPQNAGSTEHYIDDVFSYT